MGALDSEICKKISYGHEIWFSFVLGRSRRAESVPILPDYDSYASLGRATPPELEDTAVGRRRVLQRRGLRSRARSEARPESYHGSRKS